MALQSCPGTKRVWPDSVEEIKAMAERQASFFRVLGNPQRVLVLWLLSARRRTLDELAQAMGSSPESAMHHIRILQFCRLVEARKDQGDTYYHFSDNEEIRTCLVFRNRPKELLEDFEPAC